MLLSLVSTALLSLLVPATNVDAGTGVTNTNITAPGYNTATGGPFDLNDVYKAGVSGFYSNNNDPNKDYAPFFSEAITFNKNYYTFAGDGLPLHVIYFGNAGFTVNRKALIEK